MYINEITEEYIVKLSVRFESETTEFDIAILERDVKEKMIYTTVITKDDKVVGFNGKGIACDIFAAKDHNSPFIFRNVKVALTRLKNGDMAYAISTISNGTVINRREHFRTYIGKEIVFLCGGNHTPFEGILRDISGIGFSITVSKLRPANKDINGEFIADFTPGQIITLAFDDRVEETNENFSFRITGIIARKTELEDGKIIYGCRLNGKVRGLDTYVMLKERIRLKNSRQGS